MKRYFTKLATNVLFLVFVPQHPSKSQDIIPVPPLNQKIINYCAQNLGLPVSNTSDNSLVMNALKTCHAETYFNDAPAKGDKVWGVYVEKIVNQSGRMSIRLQSGAMRGSHQLGDFLLPGDILDFDNVGFIDGQGNSVNYPQHYLAIVDKVSTNSNYCRVYEQAVDGSNQEVISTLYLPDITKGVIRAYRPVLSVLSSPNNSMTMNSAILNYCIQNIGKKVGTGQCADLIDQGLQSVGAETGFRDSPKPDDYVWGALVCTLKILNARQIFIPGGQTVATVPDLSCIKPGDILQYNNVRFRWGNQHQYFTMTAIHHTALIERVSSDNSTCYVLEQNSEGRQYVTRGSFPFAGLYTGEIWVYRPIPK